MTRSPPTLMGSPSSPHQFVRSTRRARMIHDALWRIVQPLQPLRARDRRGVYPTFEERERTVASGILLPTHLSPFLVRPEALWRREGQITKEFILWVMEVLLMMVCLINDGRLDVRHTLGGDLSSVVEVFFASLDFALENWRRRRQEGF